MAKFVRKSTFELALSVFVGLALVGCGTQTGAGSAIGHPTRAIPVSPFCVAPIDGSPEEAAFAGGNCSSYSSYSAPIEGSPEQTAADLGR
jgi:hypothetical protein